MRYPFVSIVIPARHSSGTIRAVLDAALSQQYEGRVEVVVAVSDDDPDTAAIVETEYPSVILEHNPQRIAASGLNRAIAASSGSVIARCDAHTCLRPDYIRNAVSTLELTGAGVVGGNLRPAGEGIWSRTAGIAMTSPFGSGDSVYKVRTSAGPTDQVHMGVFRRAALEQVGLYDETLVRNQDYELNWRLRQRGWAVWLDPTMVSWYSPRGTLLQLARQYYDYGYWKRRMLLRNPQSLRWRQLAAPSLLTGLLASLLLCHAALPAAYGLFLLVGALVETGRRRTACGLLLPLTLATMHLSWGLGFLTPRFLKAKDRDGRR